MLEVCEKPTVVGGAHEFQACTLHLTCELALQVLAAEINFGYRFSNIRCLSVNGEAINNLAHLAKLVDGSR